MQFLLILLYWMHYPFPLNVIQNAKDPPDSEWISYEDPNQGYVKVEFSTPMPPNKPEVEALFLMISR